MTASSARPDALARFADQLTTAANAARPTLGQLHDALARVAATRADHRLELPPIVEMTAGVIDRDHELAAFARQVGIAFSSADAESVARLPIDLGAGRDGDSDAGTTATNSDGGSSFAMPALRLLLSLPDVDRIVRDGNPVDAWHDDGVGYVIDWAAIVSDSAMLACQAAHDPYVCVGGPALRGATNLLRWWTSDTRLPGTDVRPHDIGAGVVAAVHHGIDGVTDFVRDGEAAAASVTHEAKRTLQRGEHVVAQLAEEGSKLAHRGLDAVDRMAHDLVPDLGIGFG